MQLQLPSQSSASCRFEATVDRYRYRGVKPKRTSAADFRLLTLMISSVERGMASTTTQVTGTFFLLEIDVL